jgi:uncharacterized protein YyaL (SSP411 family)
VLGDDTPDFMRAYGIDERGNFEGGTTHLIDRIRRPRADFAAQRSALLAQRVGRIPPATDTKRVTSWNGYAISGLARAAMRLDDDSILAEAKAAADFVLDRLRDDEGRLLRVFAEGRAHVTGFLDDNAAMLDACLDLHRAGAGDRYVEAALDLAREITHRFYDDEANDLFLTPGDGEPLVHRPRSDNDGATPHAAGQALLGLTRVAELAGDDEIADVARRVLATHAFVLEKAPHAFPTLLRAAAVAERGISVAVVVGAAEDPATRALLAQARRSFGPEDAVIAIEPGASPPKGIAASWVEGRGTVDGKPAAYVCRGTTCSLPVTEPGDLSPLEPGE